MQYLFGVVLADFAVVLAQILISLWLLLRGLLLAGPDDIHQILVDLLVLLDVVDVGEDEVVFEVAFGSVHHE